MTERRLQIVAVALAAVAAVLLPVAIIHRAHARHHRPAPALPPVPEPPPPKIQSAQAAQAVVSMFGSMCRHEVACGVGDLGRCDYIETTMRQMPDQYTMKPCLDFDPGAARQCLEDIAARSCADFAKSLEITDLAAALDRVASCRRACR